MNSIYYVLSILTLYILGSSNSMVWGQQNRISIQDTAKIINGKRHGNWTFWYDSGIKKAEGNYYVGYRMGEWKFYWKNGKMESVGSYYWDISLRQYSESIIEQNNSLEIKEINDFKEPDTIGLYLLDEFAMGENSEELPSLYNEMMIDQGVFESIPDKWIYNGIWKYYDFEGKLTDIKIYQNGVLVKSVPAAGVIDP